MVDPKIVRAIANNMLSADEPNHNRLRGVVDEAFRRQAVLEMQPRILAIAGELADALFAEGSPSDLADRYALLFRRVARGPPRARGFAGAIAGVASGIGVTFYAENCTDDSRCSSQPGIYSRSSWSRRRDIWREDCCVGSDSIEQSRGRSRPRAALLVWPAA
jgi:cytochrome P450